MRKIVSIPAILFLFLQSFHAQVYTEQYTDRDFTLDSSIVTVDNVSFTARDEITLTQGLYAYTTVGNILFDIDETLVLPILSSEYVDPGDIETRSIDKSLDFGSVSGSFSVGSDGSANYTIPLFMPPGKGSMTPGLSLHYSSSAADGILGTGWNLSGTSTIHRLPKTMHYDSTVDGIHLDADDILAMDGNRLVLTSGTYGESGSTYQTYFETFKEVEAFGIAGDGPAYFIVEAENGFEYEFGNTTDSKVLLDGENTILAWKLNKVTDPSGNYIEYVYDNSRSGQAYLTNILYTGNANASLDPYNEIRILYQEREDSNTFYLKGHAIENTYLVRKIQSFGSGTKLKEYHFNYSYRNGTYLSEIIEYNQAGSAHNATTVSWNNYADTIVKDTLSEFFYTENARFGDFNYDGFSDYVTVDENENGFVAKLYLNQGDGDFSSTVSDSVEIDEAYVDHFVGDFNADGKSDAVVVSVDTCHWLSYYGHYEWEAFYKIRFLSGDDLSVMDTESTGTICNGPTSIPLPFNYSRQSANRFFVNDVNGDGFSDFAVLYDDGMIIYGNSQGSNFTKENVDFPASGNENLFADFTGNGKPDLAVYNSGALTVYGFENGTFSTIFSSSIPYIMGKIYTGDFNGDGIQDISYNKYYYNGYIRYGTGTGFTSESNQLNYPDDGYSYQMILDFNGDGMDDFVRMVITDELPENGWTLYFMESIGDNDFQVSTMTEVGYDFNFGNTQTADITGDGMADLMLLNKDRFLSFNPDDKHDLVKYIEDGSGIRTTISYNTLLEMLGDQYTREGNYTFPMFSVKDPLTVVESYQVTSSLHNDALIKQSEYAYTDAVIHKHGLGFLGFQSIEILSDSLHKTKSYHSFSAPDYYAFTDSTRQFYNDNLVRSVSNQKNYLTMGLTGGNSYMVYSDLITTIDYLNGNMTQTDPVYSAQGNLASSKTTYDDGSYQEVLYYNYLADGSNYPQRIVKRQKHKDDQNVFTSETSVSYNATTYQVEEVTGNDGKSTETVTEYDLFDDFGNPTRVEVTPDNLSTQVISLSYDNTGRFITSKTNPLGTTTFEYDSDWGKLISETDLYGNKTIYQYNAWGELYQTISPTGLSTTVSIDWADAGDPSSTLYTVLTSDSLATYSKKYVDFKGRSFRTANEGFKGNVYLSDTRFNALNQADSASNLYAEAGSPLWNTFGYRSYDGRLSSETHHGGAAVSYSYSNNELTRTVNGNSTTMWYDAMGNVTSVEDPLALELDYTYCSNGGYKTITGNGGTLSYQYNDAGLDSTFTDPSLGTMEKQYNALGQLTLDSDGNGNEYEYTYDNLNRPVRIENTDNASEYYTISYVASGNGKGQVSQKTYTNGTLTTSLSYTYDAMGRLRSQTKQIGNKSHSRYYKYDQAGRIDSITNSNGKKFDYRYDQRSYLTEIYYNGNLIWELDELDLDERVVNYGDNITVTSSFDTHGMLSSIQAGDLFDMSYSFNAATGNLTSRTQKIFNLYGTQINTLTDSFTYDNLDRLLQARNVADTLVVTYDNSKKERIDAKGDAGEDYSNNQTDAFRLQSIDQPTATLLNRPDQTVTYTSFNKVRTISEGDFLITFDYGPNQERVKMEVKENGTVQYTRYYFGSYELTEYPGGGYEKDTWFTSGQGVFGFNRVTNSTDSIYYVIRDHIGSVMTVAGEDGNAREFFSYDAWGRRRRADNWNYDASLSVSYTSRGYTGHEHIDETWLINMNGRVYDPLVGLFLSPDPVIQAPMNPLNYNRYSYVTNNPLKYTDPSGYKFAKLPTPMQYFNLGWLRYAGYGWSDDYGGHAAVRTGGGGGYNYGDRIRSMGGDPRGWNYNPYTNLYENSRTGETINPVTNHQGYKDIIEPILYNNATLTVYEGGIAEMSDGSWYMPGVWNTYKVKSVGSNLGPKLYAANGGGYYPEGSYSYDKTHIQYLPAEGIGLLGGWSNVRGNAKVYRGSDGKYYANVSATGYTPASTKGTVNFSGSVDVLSGNKVISSHSLHPFSGPSIIQSGRQDVGSAVFALPNVNNDVYLRFNVGYSYSEGVGYAVPIPGQGHYNIQIGFTIDAWTY